MKASPFTDMSGWIKSWWRDLRVAVVFLTRIPVPISGVVDGKALGRAQRAFPLVGLLVGISGWLVYWIAWQIGLPALASALLALAASMALTGCFHEDGLADVADGFGGGAVRERKLEIMRDSRIGTYGAAALLLGVALRAAALEALAAPDLVLAGLVAAHVLARAAILPLAFRLPQARSDGLSAYADRPSADTLRTALLLALLIALLVLPLGALLGALVCAGLAALLVALLALRQIGGYTGDVLGAAEQAVEVAVLLALAALL